MLVKVCSNNIVLVVGENAMNMTNCLSHAFSTIEYLVKITTGRALQNQKQQH